MSAPDMTPMPDALIDISARLSGCAPVEVLAAPLPYAFGSPATAGLWKVRAGDATWCVKWIRHASLWPGIAMLPPQFRQEFAEQFPWRFELDMAESGIASVMPPGLRTARLDHVESPEAQTDVMWSEWIADDRSLWELDDHNTRSTTRITKGMGCGAVCDTPYLFSCDVLGTNRGRYPRHSRRYADLARLEDELQDQRVRAFRAFVADVESRGYPQRAHEVWMDEAEAAARADRAAKD